MKINGWELVRREGQQPLAIGDLVSTFRGDTYELRGGRPPHKAASTGFVWVRPVGGNAEEEYYAGVIGAEWRKT